MWNSPTVQGTPAHVKCYSYHAVTNAIVSGGGLECCNSAWSETKMKCTNSAKSRMDANMQLTINSFRQLFPDKIISLTFPWFFSKVPDISVTAVKFPDISRFSRQVVSLSSPPQSNTLETKTQYMAVQDTVGEGLRCWWTGPVVWKCNSPPYKTADLPRISAVLGIL